MTAANCPICTKPTAVQRAGTPYFVCANCACWFQSPMPPKTWHADHEAPGELMSDQEKAINEALADRLFTVLMGGKVGRTLDIGANFPWFAKCLDDRNCAAWTIEGDGREHGLPVGILRGDFEAMSAQSIGAAVGGQRGRGDFKLITLIHCFEHIYDPLAGLRKIRELISETGRVFIRIPAHDVTGYERDLTPGHYEIHPFFHCRASILEALAQLKNAFVVESMSPLEPGQLDIVLKPITKAPKLAVGAIMKNEERDAPAMIESIRDVADHLIVVDTGSTDQTAVAVADAWPRPRDLTFVHYYGASKRDDAGEWKLWDFAKARNQFLAIANTTGDGWVLWMDADDRMLTPAVVRRLIYREDVDAWGGWIRSGGYTWIHYRLWKTNRGIVFKGKCHEFAVLDGQRADIAEDMLILHDAAPGVGESSNARNERILLEEWKEAPNPRTAFYLANTFKDSERYEHAIVWYEKRIALGEGFRDEWLFACLYKARCERALKRHHAAIETLNAAIDLAPTWNEFRMELAREFYAVESFRDAIVTAVACIGRRAPSTTLWREVDAYQDAPYRLISWSFERLGDIRAAIAWLDEAAKLIGGPDAEWSARRERLEGSLTPIPHVSGKIPGIALHRPGAIGDIIMTLNLIPALKRANPGKKIAYFCAPAIGEALRPYMVAAGVDYVMDAASWGAWSHQYERAISLVGYPLKEGYPDKPMRRHLLAYFAREMAIDVVGTDGVEALPALTLRRPPRPAELDVYVDGYATIQVRAGWSKYKEWSIARWAEVVAGHPQISFVLIGTKPEPQLEGLVDQRLIGAPLSASIAAIANARIHVGIDSFANHLTNWYWTDAHGGRRVPGVIVWGSTQASAAGYPDNVNLTRHLPCQPCFREDPTISAAARGPCINPPRELYADDTPPACMDGIDVAQVSNAVRALWFGASGRTEEADQPSGETIPSK